MSLDALESSSSETLTKATDLSNTNSITSALITLARYQATKMLAPPSTSITGQNILGTSASAPNLTLPIAAAPHVHNPAVTRNPSTSNTSTPSSDTNFLCLGLNTYSLVTTSCISVLTYNLASISPVTTDSSFISFISTAASETYLDPVTPSMLSDMSIKDDIRNKMLTSDTTEIAPAKLENLKIDIDNTKNENKPKTKLDYAEAATSTTHTVLTDAATDPVEVEINSTIIATEAVISAKQAATNLTTSPIVNIIAIEPSANCVKAPDLGISKEILVTDLTESTSICMAIPVKVSLETSTESVTPETVSLDKLLHISATNIATNLLTSILSKVTSKPNVKTTPMTIPATNITMNCITTNLDNPESNQLSANFTFNEDAASFSQTETSIETSNRTDYSKATERLDSSASKQVRFTNSTASANSNLKYY